MRDLLVQHFLDDTAGRFPHNTALSDGRHRLSFRQLADLSNRLAHCLHHAGVRRHDPVTLCLNRSAYSVVAMLGVLKADAVYVPVDARAPEERWRAVTADSRPRAVICDAAAGVKILAHLGNDLEGAAIVCLDPAASLPDADRNSFTGLDGVAAFDARQPVYRNRADDTACILYTSGSTGTPKGVLVSHLNITAYIDWAVECFDITPDDTILGTAPFHFDMSLFDIYGSLKSGATLSIASEGLTLFPPKLVDFIEHEEVTIWKGVSSLLMYLDFAGVLEPDRMPSLKKVLFAGETLPTKSLMRWMTTFPDTAFFNAYGPTEATGISLYHPIVSAPRSAEERVPIGKPCTGTEVVLLTETGEVAQPGEVGELCISGPCLSRGYLNRPEETNRAFIDEWSDGRSPGRRLYRTGDLALLNQQGDYEFVGRRDRQVKYMGYRIELGDIEHAMLSLEEIRDASAMLAEGEGLGVNELIAVVACNEQVSLAAIRRKLARKLPPYMVPKRLIRIDRIPRGDRGKVDWAALASHRPAGD